MMTSTSDSCKDGASKSNNDDDVCDVNNILENMSTVDNNLSICANCGKEGSSNNMNVCAKCKQVKYCNAVCKKVHKKKHKKDCEEHIRRAAELHDEKLFKQPPPEEDCPICFLRIPSHVSGYKYMVCCGKRICSGCCYAPLYDDQGNEVEYEKCPFCRTPTPTSVEEIAEREKKRLEVNDPIAIGKLGCYYKNGMYGFHQDYGKALELFHRAAELGYAKAYCNIAYSYDTGRGVDVDKEKAAHYYELAAMGGDAIARSNLGVFEENAGNMNRAVKHHMIAVRGGYSHSLKIIKELYSIGSATKEVYTKALQAYQEYLGEIKSLQRDKAAAAHEDYRYYV